MGTAYKMLCLAVEYFVVEQLSVNRECTLVVKPPIKTRLT